jgi:hypothetical protein
MIICRWAKADDSSIAYRQRRQAGSTSSNYLKPAPAPCTNATVEPSGNTVALALYSPSKVFARPPANTSPDAGRRSGRKVNIRGIVIQPEPLQSIDGVISVTRRNSPELIST